MTRFSFVFFVLSALFFGMGLGYLEGKHDADKWWQDNMGHIYWFGADWQGNKRHLDLSCPKRDMACISPETHSLNDHFPKGPMEKVGTICTSTYPYGCTDFVRPVEERKAP